MWPDIPLSAYWKYCASASTPAITIATIDSGLTLFTSHYRANQHWHSMDSGQTYAGMSLSTNLKNEGVKKKIIGQAYEWYKNAIDKETSNKGESLLNLGRLCHMIQDSYCMSHCWRRYIGDTNTLFPLLSGVDAIIDPRQSGNIWTFQNYGIQDGSFHKCADKPEQKSGTTTRTTIGYKSAENTTKEIILIAPVE